MARMNNPSRIAPDKRSVIASALLRGGEIADVRDALIEAGASMAVADYEAKRAAKDPVFQTAAILVRRLGKRDWVLGNYRRLDELRASERAPTVHKIDPKRFADEFYARIVR